MVISPCVVPAGARHITICSARCRLGVSSSWRTFEPGYVRPLRRLLRTTSVGTHPAGCDPIPGSRSSPFEKNALMRKPTAAAMRLSAPIEGFARSRSTWLMYPGDSSVARETSAIVRPAAVRASRSVSPSPMPLTSRNFRSATDNKFTHNNFLYS